MSTNNKQKYGEEKSQRRRRSSSPNPFSDLGGGTSFRSNSAKARQRRERVVSKLGDTFFESGITTSDQAKKYVISRAKNISTHNQEDLDRAVSGLEIILESFRENYPDDFNDLEESVTRIVLAKEDQLADFRIRKNINSLKSIKDSDSKRIDSLLRKITNDVAFIHTLGPKGHEKALRIEEEVAYLQHKLSILYVFDEVFVLTDEHLELSKKDVSDNLKALKALRSKKSPWRIRYQKLLNIDPLLRRKIKIMKVLYRDGDFEDQESEILSLDKDVKNRIFNTAERLLYERQAYARQNIENALNLFFEPPETNSSRKKRLKKYRSNEYLYSISPDHNTLDYLAKLSLAIRNDIDDLWSFLDVALKEYHEYLLKYRKYIVFNNPKNTKSDTTTSEITAEVKTLFDELKSKIFFNIVNSRFFKKSLKWDKKDLKSKRLEMEDKITKKVFEGLLAPQDKKNEHEKAYLSLLRAYEKEFGVFLTERLKRMIAQKHSI